MLAVGWMDLEQGVWQASNFYPVCWVWLRTMPRGLRELRERGGGKREKPRVSSEKASEKMALKLCLEQIFKYGDGEDVETNDHRQMPWCLNSEVWRTGHQIWGHSRPHDEGSQHHDLWRRVVSKSLGWVSWNQVCSKKSDSISVTLNAILGKGKMEKEG